jgi:translation initiation factor 5
LITSERHEKALLGGTERFIGEHGEQNPALYEQVSKILMLYYNDDLISEEIVAKWGTKASKKYVDLPTSKKVRKSAETFLTWLAEAESDDEDDDED